MYMCILCVYKNTSYRETTNLHMRLSIHDAEASQNYVVFTIFPDITNLLSTMLLKLTAAQQRSLSRCLSRNHNSKIGFKLAPLRGKIVAHVTGIVHCVRIATVGRRSSRGVLQDNAVIATKVRINEGTQDALRTFKARNHYFYSSDMCGISPGQC